MNNNNKPNTATTTSSECSNCSITTTNHRSLPLHHVRLRGIYRRLCTSCVLKLHPGSFCPTCFDLFDTSPPHHHHHHRVSCQKCPSISHPACVPNIEEKKPYTCPPCSNPNFSFFDVKASEDGKEVWRVIDKKAARVLLCASRIAAVSMSKAVVVARAEAERRVREAALSRKRAREALEHVAAVVAKEKAKRKEEGSAEGSVHVWLKEKYCKGNGGVVAEKNCIENQGKVGGVMDGSREVSANLKNGVSNADGVARPEYQNHGSVSEKKRSSELTNLDSNNEERAKANNGLFSVSSIGGQLHRMGKNSFDRNEEVGLK